MDIDSFTGGNVRLVSKEASEFSKNFSDAGDARITFWESLLPDDKDQEVWVVDRQYEYYYVLKKCQEYNVRNKTILDVGSAGSVLPSVLAVTNRVTCLDVRKWPLKVPNLTSIQSDLFQLKGSLLKPKGFGPFDVITCISAVEHFGLARFGDQKDANGDIKGVAILRSFLKPKGLMILTAPFGQPTVAYPIHRVYDSSRFLRMTAGLKILDKQFFGPIEREHFYRPCTEEETYSVDTAKGYAIICCLLQK